MYQDTTVLLKEPGPKRTGFLNNGLPLKILLLLGFPMRMRQTKKSYFYLLVGEISMRISHPRFKMLSFKKRENISAQLVCTSARMTGGFQRLHSTHQWKHCLSAPMKSAVTRLMSLRRQYPGRFLMIGTVWKESMPDICYS